MDKHAELSSKFISNCERTDWHNQTLWFVRDRRDKMANSVPEWELLRETASRIKNHTISKLDFYLNQFEEKALQNGAIVHWASTAAEHNEIVLNIIKKNNATRVVKSKSMLTEECGLNHFLEKNDIEIVDTDLGERIVQLRKEPPSHIVLPAIHLKKEDVSKTFNKFLNTEKGNNDPTYLTSAARAHLREKFLNSQVAITGVNFGVAENGAVVVCTNEGNADMGVQCASVHIACMGIEKVIPRNKDLGVFIRLLARSATGQAITSYTSHYLKPAEGKQLHIIIVDNGRSKMLADPDYKNALKCIRCAACFNTCPVFRRSGGYSYGYSIAGPIGSVLAPTYDIKKYHDLPFASSLCGSCSNVCPSKINLHEMLWSWRQEISKKGISGKAKTIVFYSISRVLGHPGLYRFCGKMARIMLKRFSFLFKSKTLNPWYKGREMPMPPEMSFRDWYLKRK